MSIEVMVGGMEGRQKDKKWSWCDVQLRYKLLSCADGRDKPTKFTTLILTS